MRAQTVNFERGQDPKSALAVGLRTWENLKPGDILRSKKNFGITNYYTINNTSQMPWVPKDQYLLITSYRYKVFSGAGDIILSFIPFDTIEEAKEAWQRIESENIPIGIEDSRNIYLGMGGHISDDEKKVKSKLEIIQRSGRVSESLEFERGQDPKDALSIGNRNARKFRKVLKEKDYLGAHLETMLDGLKEGSISEREAEQFVYGAISAFDEIRHLLWYDWFYEDPIVFWGSDVEKFIITFGLPEDQFWGDLNIRCEIFEESKSKNFQRHYEITSVLQSQKPGESTEEHFHQNNMFLTTDNIFSMKSAINQISRVVEATIKNMS